MKPETAVAAMVDHGREGVGARADDQRQPVELVLVGVDRALQRGRSRAPGPSGSATSVRMASSPSRMKAISPRVKPMTRSVASSRLALGQRDAGRVVDHAERDDRREEHVDRAA